MVGDGLHVMKVTERELREDKRVGEKVSGWWHGGEYVGDRRWRCRHGGRG